MKKDKTKINFKILMVLIFLFTMAGGFSACDEDLSSYTSMKLVDDLALNVRSITPVIDDAKITPGDADDYLRSTSCLGYLGPLGPYGPLGLLGPIGSNTWNVSYWISYIDWVDWNDDITGPLGPTGPLGENGPVAPGQYYGLNDPAMTLFNTNDFARHSRGMGIWTPLGPIGPLGALGPLGPLGPIGTHGYAINSDGEYIKSGVVKRVITMWFDASHSTKLTYELYEKYSESFAESKTDNDTSFMVEGTSSSTRDVDTFQFTAATNQIVTIVLVPEAQFDDFDLALLDSNNNIIATSDEQLFIDWIQIKVPAGTMLKAQVRLYSSGHIFASNYRLYVTGSTANLVLTEIDGDHIKTY